MSHENYSRRAKPFWCVNQGVRTVHLWLCHNHQLREIYLRLDPQRHAEVIKELHVCPRREAKTEDFDPIPFSLKWNVLFQMKRDVDFQHASKQKVSEVQSLALSGEAQDSEMKSWPFKFQSRSSDTFTSTEEVLLSQIRFKKCRSRPNTLFSVNFNWKMNSVIHEGFSQLARTYRWASPGPFTMPDALYDS